MTLDTLTPDEIPDPPTVDRWSPTDFETHCAAEGIELHARPRFGGPPILGAALAVGVGKVVLEAIDECDGVEI
jgi:hypothetical protein